MGTTAKEEKSSSNNSAGIGKAHEEKHVRDHHPWDYHVSGPRDLASPHWRDLIFSSWRNPSYRRIAVSCFVQAAYLLELDRQAKRTGAQEIASRWWKQFKYKLVRTLVDERDGSIYGAVLEWDHSAAIADYLFVRPWGAPKAAIALRGTIIKGSTIRRDFEDDFRLVTWDCLKGTVRFRGTMEAVKAMISKHGAHNVCIGGHSLGAGIALHVGKELAKQGVYIDCHLFNPPSVSLPQTLRFIQKTASLMWRGNKSRKDSDDENGAEKLMKDVNGWMPHLYINDADYICMHYADRAGTATMTSSHKGNNAPSRLFLAPRGQKSLMEAHGLQQWWSNDIELQRSISDSRLLTRQLRSMYLESPSEKS
ncbi:alpha/beta-Hydrolases superfamily protein [Rhynchospora pubera]|uniref:Alpha/beta-Hydrolases superfamily protein n=1 Tax=Rhynchospora pubera TaxID=906938 RepID=A0AAV8FLL6_9POAL|nr:alpha/beta-Hydrolases superfamily protein [Rhynchospora pubera]KAJ4818235.1 alpha/beta-Hydrolases superfamily protein [Rhynchospora pubera]